MAGFARGSQRGLSYIKEVTPGVTPTLPAMTVLRNTGDSLIQSKDSFQSEELRADRAIVDVTMGNTQTGGGMDFEFSYGSFDDFLVAALYADTTDLAAGITNGVTEHSFTIEKSFPNVPFYQVFSGVHINTLSLNIQGNSTITGSFDLLGTGYESGTTTIADSTIAASTGNIFNSYDLSIRENGIEIGIGLSLALNINNNLQAAFALGDDEAKEVIDGRCIVDGTIQIYFEDATIYDKFKNDTESSIEVDLKDTLGAVQYTIELPRIKYTTADNPVSDEGPVNVSMAFQALQDATEGHTIKITKF